MLFTILQSDDDSTIQEPSDATSYNPLPKVNVPREKYIPDDFEKSLDALDGFKLRDPDQFEIHNPVLELSDDESLLTEGKRPLKADFYRFFRADKLASFTNIIEKNATKSGTIGSRWVLCDRF